MLKWLRQLADVNHLNVTLDPAQGPIPLNLADLAIAKLQPQALVTSHSGIYSLGAGTLHRPSPGTSPDYLWTTVGKTGRTTGSTLGVVVDTSANIWVPMRELPDGRAAYGYFVNQLAVVPLGSYPRFSDSGDSGSIVYDVRTWSPVGLLFAGGESTTFVNPWPQVMSELGTLTPKGLQLWTPE